MRLPGYLALIGGMAAALALQAGVLSRLHLPGAAPDLLLVAVVAVALAWGETFGMVTGWCVGIAADLVPPAAHAVGREAFVLCLFGYLAGRTGLSARGSALRPMLLIACLAALSPLLYAALGLAVGEPIVPWGQLGTVSETAALYAALLAPFVVPLVLALARRAELRGPLPTQRARTTSLKSLGRREPTGATQGLQ